MTNTPSNRGFTLVGDDEAAPQHPGAQAQPANTQATQLLILALTALTQRTIIALSRLFTLLTVASAFWLWISVPNPSQLQLVALGMYALFVLAANYLVRK